MFKGCDTIWCCWANLAQFLYRSVWVIRWPIAIYALLYAVGASIFLVALRIRSENEQLTVDRKSWCYLLAHPLRYAGHSTKTEKNTSICVFYATMFNMLLTVWPIALFYWIICTVVGSVGGFLICSTIVYPDLGEEMFLATKILLKRENGKPFLLSLVSGPTTILILALFHLHALLMFLERLGWALLCLLPLIAVIGAISWSSRKVYAAKLGEGTTSSAVKEFLGSKKDKFCKIVRFK